MPVNSQSTASGEVVTLDVVARAAGVSPSTVSRILNGTARVGEAKRAAVEAAIARFDYQPNVLARGLAQGRTLSIGVLTQDIESPFYGEALRGIEDALAGTGFIPLFVSGHWNGRSRAHDVSARAQGRWRDRADRASGRRTVD